MTRLGLALAAFAALALAPQGALAQRAAARSPNAPPPAAGAPAAPTAKQLADQRTRGMKEAPAVLAATGVQTCQLADALFLGQGTEKDDKGKETGKLTAYEVACQTGPGYILVSRPAQPKPQALNCIIAESGQTKCTLPQNRDFKAALAPAVKQAGRACTITNVSYVGSSTTAGQDFYEVACSPELGFRMGVSTTSAAAPVVNDCLSLLGQPQACTLTTKEQVLAAYAPTIAKAGKTCTVSDLRWIGKSPSSGETFTEVACGTTPGFVLTTDAQGTFKTAIDCSKASGIGGGCKLTDVTVAQNAEAGTYTKLAARAGFPCAVKQYRFIGMDPENREVVELACSDRPDGAIAILSETAGKSQIFDCVRAKGVGESECKLTQTSVLYPKYTQALASKGRTTCTVNGTGYLGRTTDKREYVETSCADGAPGWVIGFQEGTQTVADLITCRQATNSGFPCKLATNIAGNKGS